MISSETPTFTLHEAADTLGVHYMTVYRYVRLGVIAATKVGGSWRIEHADLIRFREGDPPPETLEGGGSAPWSQRLESRMVAGDVNGAWSVVEAALASGHSPSEIYVDLLAPALHSIGERWHRGDLAVEDEHLGTAVAHRLVGRLGPRFNRRGRDRGSVIVAMPPGERHGLGLAMLADVLRGSGYAVLDLGPDTPVASLVRACERSEGLLAVCLSAVMDDGFAGLSEMAAAVRESCGKEIVVLMGGAAVTSAEQAAGLGADGWAGDAISAQQRLDEVIGSHGSGSGSS